MKATITVKIELPEHTINAIQRETIRGKTVKEIAAQARIMRENNVSYYDLDKQIVKEATEFLARKFEEQAKAYTSLGEVIATSTIKVQ